MKRKIKKFRFGLKQIIGEVATGLLTTVILTLLSNQGWLPDKVLLVINIILIIGNILLIRQMWSWGVFYTVGWLIGSFLFFKIGLFNTWQIILYLALPIFALIQRLGGIAEEEMYRTFNMGLGMVIVVAPEQVSAFQALVEEPTWVIGEVVPTSDNGHRVHLR